MGDFSCYTFLAILRKPVLAPVEFTSQHKVINAKKLDLFLRCSNRKSLSLFTLPKHPSSSENSNINHTLMSIFLLRSHQTAMLKSTLLGTMLLLTLLITSITIMTGDERYPIERGGGVVILLRWGFYLFCLS